MKTKLSQAIAAVAVMGAATAASAAVNSNNMGDTLLFPLYTVEAGNQTTLHLTNTKDEYKAVKVRFRRASDSYDVLDFNLYLSPKDMWTGVVTLGEDGNPVLTSGDNSCVSGPEAALRGGKSFERGESTKGHIEIIEMASWTEAQANAVTLANVPGTLSPAANDGLSPASTVTKSSLSYAVKHKADGKPGNCGLITAAWAYDDSSNQPLGLWSKAYTSQAPNGALSFVNANGGLGFKPTGGLYGNAYVINVNQAWSASYAPTAMTLYNGVGVPDQNNHHMPRLGLPDLHGTVASPQAINTKFVEFLTAQALDGVIDYAENPSEFDSAAQKLYDMTVHQNNGMDANGIIAADLATTNLYADYSIGGSARANTELAITFPIKYTQTADGINFGGNPYRDQRIAVTFMDREEGVEKSDPSDWQWSPWAPSAAAFLKEETNLVRLSNVDKDGNVIFAGRQDLGEENVVIPSQFRGGWVDINFQMNNGSGSFAAPAIGLSNIVVKNSESVAGVNNTYGITHDLKGKK